jgi:hypothetical protein
MTDAPDGGNDNNTIIQNTCANIRKGKKDQIGCIQRASPVIHVRMTLVTN